MPSAASWVRRIRVALLRGLKTLPLRIRQQQANAMGRRWLLRAPARDGACTTPACRAIRAAKSSSAEAIGPGRMISFEIDDPRRVPAFCPASRVFLFAESLGGVESLITYPAVQTHADLTRPCARGWASATACCGCPSGPRTRRSDQRPARFCERAHPPIGNTPLVRLNRVTQGAKATCWPRSRAATRPIPSSAASAPP
jgi:hypothetical protein